MGMEGVPENNSEQVDFSNEERKLEEKVQEYMTSGEEKGREWADKIKEMFEERKREIIEAEDRVAFDIAWQKMNDFVEEELKLGI